MNRLPHTRLLGMDAWSGSRPGKAQNDVAVACPGARGCGLDDAPQHPQRQGKLELYNRRCPHQAEKPVPCGAWVSFALLSMQRSGGSIRDNLVGRWSRRAPASGRHAALLVFLAGTARARVIAADLRTGPHHLTDWRLVVAMMIVVAVGAMHVAHMVMVMVAVRAVDIDGARRRRGSGGLIGICHGRLGFRCLTATFHTRTPAAPQVARASGMRPGDQRRSFMTRGSISCTSCPSRTGTDRCAPLWDQPARPAGLPCAGASSRRAMPGARARPA